eukprot:Sro669_g184460.1 n/a (118) ;mRNA; r:4654-5007
MYFAEYHGAEETCLKMVKDDYRGQPMEWWKGMEPPEASKPTGIKDIKWKELYEKWGKVVPQEKKKGFKYYEEAPSAEKLAAIKEHTKQARELRQSRQATTVEDNTTMVAKQATRPVI